MILKNDGWYDFYIIEELQSDGTWGYPDYKTIGYPKSFEPENKCQILTGLPGTFSVVQAHQAISKLRKEYPTSEFRLLFLMVSQQTKIVS